MKIRGLFKKAAATLMAAVTALSILPATTAFAAGDIGTISFSHTYDSSGNAMRYNSSATFDGHTAGGTGNYKYRMFVDGENAFCIMITHNEEIAQMADRTIRIEDGKVVSGGVRYAR